MRRETRQRAWLAVAAAVTAVALMASMRAQASLVGITVFAEAVGGGGAPPAGAPRTIFRVYAEFTSPIDRVNVWGGGGNLGPCVIRNVLADGTTPESGFTNIGGAAGQLAPLSPGTTRDWDTYMTIGVRYGFEAPGGIDPTAALPGTPDFINGATWTAPSAGGGVYITPNDDQGRADFINSGNDTNLRVLLMQLVVNQGEYISGTFGVAWGVDGQPGSGGTIPNMNFPLIPAPAGVGVLALGALTVRRRRRTC